MAGPETAYLDHNATTPLRLESRDAMLAALAAPGNPSSVHRWGRAARARLEAARAGIAAAIGLPAGGSLVFTSGGTEANHLALRGVGRPIFTSTIEHDSVLAAGLSTPIPVTGAGIVDLAALKALLAVAAAPVLVSVMVANNETGIIQPLPEIIRLAHAHGALVHADAIQALGKIPFDMAALGLDLASVSGHKIGGPTGIGALAVAPGISVSGLQRGGGQERGLRAGTENLPGIAGFAAAATFAVAELEAFAGLARLRDRMEALAIARLAGVAIFGRDRPRLPNTSCLALPGIESALQVMALDLAGIGVSAGAACSSGKLRPSHVLAAMGVPPDLAGAAIRVSLGRETKEAEIDLFLDAWTDLARRQGRTLHGGHGVAI